MEITEIQISLTAIEVREKDGVHAFVRVVFDDAFVVRDIKVMEADGCIRLGMPSRRLLDPCPGCRKRVDLGTRHCSNCGLHLAPRQVDSRRSHVDVAHPLNQEFRRMLEERITAAYNEKVAPEHHLQVRTSNG